MKRFLVSFLLAVLVPITAAAQEAPLTLERAVELALTRNERAEIADETAEAAEARVQRVRSFFFPQVTIQTLAQQRAGEIGDADRSTISSTAFLAQPLFNASAFPLYGQARLERDAARLFADDEKRLLAFDAADAFLATLGFEQVLRAANNRRDFARTSLEDARARFEAGLVSSNDVTRAELELATAELQVAQAVGSVDSSRIQLGNLLNAEIDGPLVEPSGLLAAADDPPAVDPGVLASAQQQRPDIRGARARVEGLRLFAEEPSRRFIPSLTLNANTRNINDGPVSNRNNDAQVGVTVGWPVFDAGIRRAERAERTALARAAELELELTMRDVERQIRGAAVQLTSEQASLRQAIEAVRAARRNANETNELYRQGLASALELADANQRLFEAEVAEATARYRMARAYLAVREARGVGAVDR